MTNKQRLVMAKVKKTPIEKLAKHCYRSLQAAGDKNLDKPCTNSGKKGACKDNECISGKL